MIYLRQAQHSLGIGIAKGNSEFFTLDEANSMVYCNNIAGLIESLCVKYDAMEWRLFINSYTRRLKAVLLNIENMSSIPIVHSVELDESQQTMKCLLSALNYHTHKWLICADLTVVEHILRLQEGYTKPLASYAYGIAVLIASNMSKVAIKTMIRARIPQCFVLPSD